MQLFPVALRSLEARLVGTPCRIGRSRSGRPESRAGTCFCKQGVGGFDPLVSTSLTKSGLPALLTCREGPETADASPATSFEAALEACLLSRRAGSGSPYTAGGHVEVLRRVQAPSEPGNFTVSSRAWALDSHSNARSSRAYLTLCLWYNVQAFTKRLKAHNARMSLPLVTSADGGRCAARETESWPGQTDGSYARQQDCDVRWGKRDG